MSVSVQKLATGAGVASTGASAAWANEGNARDATAAAPDNNTYATAAAPAKNAFIGSIWPFAFAVGDVPDNATILSVLVEVQWKMSAATSTYSLDATCFADAAQTITLNAFPGVTDAAGPIADTGRSFSLTTLPTIAQLRAGIYVRVRHVRGTSNTATTGSLDFIRVTVTYSVPTTANISMNATMTMTSTTTAQHSVAKTIAAAVVETPANARVAGRNQVLTTIASLAVQRQQPRTLSAALSASPTLQAARKLYQALAASQTLSSVMAFQRTHLTPLAVSLSLNPIPSMERLMTRALALTMLGGSSQKKQQPRTLANTMTASAAVVEQKTLYRTIPLSVTFAPTTTRGKLTSFALSMLPSTVLQKLVTRALAATIVESASQQKKQPRALAASPLMAPSLIEGRRFARTMAASIVLTPASTHKSMVGFAFNAFTSLASSVKALIMRQADAQSVLIADTTRRVSEALANGIILAPGVELVQGRPTVKITLSAQPVLIPAEDMMVKEALAAVTALIAELGTSRVYAYPWITSVLDAGGYVTAAGEANIRLTSAHDPLATRITGGKGV